MMISMPTAGSLSDLMTLLQLLQAASDPKTSKATIGLIQKEREKYDAAVAASLASETEAKAAHERAQFMRDEALSVKAKCEAEVARLDEKQTEVVEVISQLEAKRYAIAEDQAALTGARQQLAAREAAFAKAKAESLQALAEERQKIDTELAKAQVATEAAEALKAEYEAKLAKIKALTA